MFRFSMHILITGGAGFLGQRLAHQLLQHPIIGKQLQKLTLVDVVASPHSIQDARLVSIQSDLSDPEATKALITADVTVVYHLAAVVSAQAEANFDLGMAVNGEGTRLLLEAVRHNAPGALFVFASSLAVFGGRLPAVIEENTAVRPQSSYGTQKAIAELWVADYTRKGFIDGRVLRLPTVCVRPGKPNAAASSFASGIIREPLNGETAVCPVDTSLPLWLSSPETVVANLVHTLGVSAYQLGDRRTVNLPGITVTAQEMINSLAEVAGPDVAKLIQSQPDASIAQIVASWPSRFDVRRAIALGFTGDRAFSDIIRAYQHSMKSHSPVL
ncbi:MAG: D-erythronate dehydrogenase [Cyanobacteria bacterium J06598_3]